MPDLTETISELRALLAALRSARQAADESLAAVPRGEPIPAWSPFWVKEHAASAARKKLERAAITALPALLDAAEENRELRERLSGKTMHDAAAVERERIIELVESEGVRRLMFLRQCAFDDNNQGAQDAIGALEAFINLAVHLRTGKNPYDDSDESAAARKAAVAAMQEKATALLAEMARTGQG